MVLGLKFSSGFHTARELLFSTPQNKSKVRLLVSQRILQWLTVPSFPALSYRVQRAP